MPPPALDTHTPAGPPLLAAGPQTLVFVALTPRWEPEHPRSGPEPRAAPAGHLPVGVRLVDDQQHLGLPGGGGRGRGRVHQPGRGCRLLHRLGERAEEAAAHRRRRGRLRRGLRRGRRGGLRPPLGSRRGDRGRRRGRGRARAGGRRRRRLLGLRPLQVSHVAIGQVGDEAAVGQSAPQEVHHLA